MKKERMIYLDILRIIATYAVILEHLSAQYWYTTDVFSREWSAFNFWDGIMRWSVPIFVMISGVLYLDDSRHINIKKHCIKLIRAFIFWSAIYALYTACFNPESKGLVTWGANFVMGRYHMWFIFMIIGMYISVPIIKRIITNNNEMLLFLKICIVVSFIIPTVKMILDLYCKIFNKVVLDQIIDTIFVPYNNLTKDLMLGYIPYFVLGYYLNKVKLEKNKRKLLYIGAIVAFIITVFFSLKISQLTGVPHSELYGEFILNVFFQSIGIFVLVKNMRLNLSESGKKIIEVIANNCFSIYLMHDLIMNIMNDFLGINSLSFNSFVAIPILGVFIFAIGFIISFLAHQIPDIFRKY